MIINVKVKANAKENKIFFDKKINLWKVYTTITPEKGKANIKVVEIISDYFKIPKSNIELLTGPKNNLKTFKIIKS
jgi:hypothetical protein